MQKANCLVNLGNDPLNQVFVEGITPAEYLVLATIHLGHDAVQNLQVTGEVEDPDDAQILRDLQDKYVTNAKVVKSLFPGFGTKLPRTFAEVAPRGGEGGVPLPVTATDSDEGPVTGSSDILG
jgi:hypothetical protein